MQFEIVEFRKYDYFHLISQSKHIYFQVEIIFVYWNSDALV